MVILLLLAGIDAGRYVLAVRRIERVASTIGQMVSVNTVGSLTPADLTFYESSAFVMFPLVLTDSTQRGMAWNADLSLTVSSVNFKTTNGVTQAYTSWSTGPAARACGTPLTQVSDSAPPSSTTLAVDAYGPNSVIVVDTSFAFRPLVASSYLPTLNIARSYYVQPRYVTSITLSGGSGPTTNQC